MMSQNETMNACMHVYLYMCCALCTLAFGELKAWCMYLWYYTMETRFVCSGFLAIVHLSSRCSGILPHICVFICSVQCILYMDLTLDTMHLIFMFCILCAIAVILHMYVCVVLCSSQPKKQQQNTKKSISKIFQLRNTLYENDQNACRKKNTEKSHKWLESSEVDFKQFIFNGQVNMLTVQCFYNFQKICKMIKLSSLSFA